MSEHHAVLTVLPGGYRPAARDCDASHNLIGGLLSCDLPASHLGSMHYDAENGIEWRGSNDTPQQRFSLDTPADDESSGA